MEMLISGLETKIDEVKADLNALKTDFKEQIAVTRDSQHDPANLQPHSVQPLASIHTSNAPARKHQPHPHAQSQPHPKAQAQSHAQPQHIIITRQVVY